MRTYKLLIIPVILLMSYATLLAQDGRDYLQNINTCLLKNDCRCAKKWYIAYKNVTGKTDAGVEKQIAACEGNLHTSNDSGKVEEKPFVTVEQMPGFPGGETEMHRFINDNLKYPVVAQESGIQGRVTIRFVVTKTGAISDVTVIRGIDPSCDKEAVRVVKAMPKWIPGKQNGLNVPVYFTLPVVFRLSEPGYKQHTIQKGETLYSISKFYGITVEELIKANPEINNNEFRTGNILEIRTK
ncbi:TonB family protein [Dysgonomonas termitidis]|uniref:TonB family protein n=1 Tax=Dysgonomonas termitidis TaxID=1516126 RepID=A0ABV9KZC2_9BACT